MNKFHTVKENSDFYDAIHNGIYYKDNIYSIYIRKNNLDRYRFGISVSKKLGNAVNRNYFKRQTRYIIDKYKKYYQNGYDYIIILRKDFPLVDFSQKSESFIELINKINDRIKKEQ